MKARSYLTRHKFCFVFQNPSTAFYCFTHTQPPTCKDYTAAVIEMSGVFSPHLKMCICLTDSKWIAEIVSPFCSVCAFRAKRYGFCLQTNISIHTRRLGWGGEMVRALDMAWRVLGSKLGCSTLKLAGWSYTSHSFLSKPHLNCAEDTSG